MRMGHSMSTPNLSAFLGEGVNLDASEAEIAKHFQTRLKELAFMACFIAMPYERRLKIKEAITLFEGCAGLYPNNPVAKPILRAAANSR